MKKECTKCDTEKLLSEFSNKASSKDGKSSICLKCTREYTRRHYLENKTYYRNKAKKHTDKLKDWLIKYKSKLKCIVCGENRWWVLDFHHRDPSSKEGDISSLMRLGSKEKVLKEIKKCDVLCANCHRDLHYQENQV